MTAFTDRELDIMSILWLGDATAAEVRDTLGTQGVELAYNTVLSMLRILQEKGHVTYVVEGRAHRYRPLVQRDEAGRSAVRRLLSGVFNRSPELLLTHLLHDKPLDRDTLERLRAMVDSELASTATLEGRTATKPARRRNG